MIYEIFLSKIKSVLLKIIIPVLYELKIQFERQLLESNLLRIKIFCIVYTIIKLTYALYYIYTGGLEGIRKTL